ncbi:MAG: hypothetical protein AB1801_22160, partial [Chloroflexota bacterium]
HPRPQQNVPKPRQNIPQATLSLNVTGFFKMKQAGNLELTVIGGGHAGLKRLSKNAPSGSMTRVFSPTMA